MEILGIIPARGGSKSIPLKNIKEIKKKPLIAWTIHTALESNLNRVITTTDDINIAKIAKKYGAETPFIRPKELATDILGIEPVIKHTLEWLKENENYFPDAVMLLLPTSPLRQTHHINEAIELFKTKKPDSIVSVHEAIANSNPHWMLKKDDLGNVTLFHGEPLKNIVSRRQDLPKTFIRNDIIYLLKPENVFAVPSTLYGDNVELYQVDHIYDADINTEEDWEICIHKHDRIEKLKKNNKPLP